MTAPSLLAFDSATDRLYIGLCVGARQWHDDADGGPGASAALIGRVTTLLADAATGLRELDAIAFGRGPGAFTGLRTACAVAQGLAFGSGRPLLAIDTLMALAEDARMRSGADDVWVAVDARMGEIYAAHYTRDGSTWRTLVEPSLHAPQQLAALWQRQAPLVIAGNAPLAFAGQLPDCGARHLADARPDGRALLACARAAWPSAALDPAEAWPLYVRNRVASTMAEQAAAALSRPAPR